MTTTASQLQTIIDRHRPALQQLPEQEFSYKPLPHKWSKKEILGHLIDSAQSNLRRFVIAQYEEKPHIVYNQDKWVAINHYQQCDSQDIIDLWYLLNKQIVTVLQHTPAEMYQRLCQTQDQHTIEWLAADYVKHLLHHLHVVLDLEPVAYP